MSTSTVPAAASTATIRAILERDPTWAAYALADLQPHMAQHCAWYVAPDCSGLALIYTGLPIATLFTFGEAQGVEASIRQIELPARVYRTVPEEHVALTDCYYDFSADVRPMVRMALPADAAMETAPDVTVRLQAADAGALRALYAHGGDFAPDAFEPSQIDAGVFIGIRRQNGELLAAGGTHVVDWQAGIAAIGNMYTRPDQRGHGHGAAILRSIVRTLQDGGVTNIVLNVDRRNAGARRLYECHGFVQHCRYVEGVGEKREKTNQKRETATRNS